MTVYSYNAKQLKNKTGPKKPFLTEKKKNILLVAGAFVALGFMSAVADLSTKQTEKVSPTPVAVAQQVAQTRIDEAEDQRLRKIAQEKADRELQEQLAKVQQPVQKVEQSRYKYTKEGAVQEMCEAGRQYRQDVIAGYMSHSQAENETRLYARHMQNISPAEFSTLFKAGNNGLWFDRC
jgi:hypothetical protein